MLVRQLRHRMTDFGTRLARGIFNILSPMWRGRRGRGVPPPKIWVQFIGFTHNFFKDLMDILGQLEKLSSQPQLLLGKFRKIIIFFFNFAELNHFWVVRSHIQLYKSGEQWECSCSGLKQLCTQNFVLGSDYVKNLSRLRSARNRKRKKQLKQRW